MAISNRQLTVYALRLFLKPMVRFCLRRTMQLKDVVEILKRVLVEEARSEIEKRGAKATVSRISVMTGVHRKDVMRICDRPPQNEEGMGVPFRVISFWRTSPEFRSISGRPKVLSCEGAQSEFADLVRKVNRELNPYTVLFELERIGVVERTSHGVKLNMQIFAPKGSEKPSFEMLAQDQEDLFEAVMENVEGKSELPNLHIATSYDNIPEKAIPQIKKWLLDRGDDWHREIRAYLERFDRDVMPRKQGVPVTPWTVTVGTFGRAQVTSTSEEEKSV